MVNWNTIDWRGCDLVEMVPGKVSGVPLLKGTRLPVETIVNCYEAGMPSSEISEDFPAATAQIISEILTYARRQGRAMQHDCAA